MATDVVKGGWAPDEDERLVKAIEKHGTRWSLVAQVVQTRNSDQCAKRWTDTLNPAIDRTTWTAAQDDLLIRAVNEHGKVWTKIVKTYFPGRTGLSAKNRYNSVTRFVSTSAAARPRRDSVAPYERRKSVSSASSALDHASPSSTASPMIPSDALPSATPLIPSMSLQSDLSWADQLSSLSTPSLPSTSMSAMSPPSLPSDIFVGTKFESMHGFPLSPGFAEDAAAYEQSLRRQSMQLQQQQQQLQNSLMPLPEHLSLNFPTTSAANLEDRFFQNSASMFDKAYMSSYSSTALPSFDGMPARGSDLTPYPEAPQPTMPGTNINASWPRQWDQFTAEQQHMHHSHNPVSPCGVFECRAALS
ncbi:hypothetical protein BD626DRAFT_400019 [Schizophyllum amplum]|uniref:Homeodomain-like protein n=1 Tax=Schizophyllum amplum TaxID=97359 RepID=A0A550CJ71_9AGAR|nr:hypothetical protein BD626DRAFT_400019 [Auriculariopsis ampla]